MTVTMIGIDSVGAACIKITKGTLNPYNTPDANYGSFYYNSKWSFDVKFSGMEKTPYAGGINRYPAGSTASNYKKGTRVPGGTQLDVVIKNSWFPNLLYDLPLYDMQVKQVSNGRFIHCARVTFTSASDASGRRATYWRTLDANFSAWWLNNTNAFYNTLGLPGNALVYSGSLVGGSAADYEKTVAVWQLPGDDSPIIDSAPLSPVPGQKSIVINNTRCAVAKPGYNVDTATSTQLAFDSSNRPAKVIYGDDIALPAGTTNINLGFEATEYTLLNMYLYQTGGNIVFPMAPVNNTLSAQYEFIGSTLRIYNSIACRARFIVIAFDDSVQSSGANNVLRQFTAGGENVVQFLKPGAADPPRLSDIVLDSRWPCLQILKTDYIPVAAVANHSPDPNGGVAHDITYPVTGGVFPIVKYMTVHNDPSYGRLIRPPATRLTDNFSGGLDWYNDGYSTYCELIGSGLARFWTFNGNPVLETVASGTSWAYEWAPDPIIGIRYYIFGIPS